MTNQTLTAKSIGDSECIFTAELIKRTAKTATVKVRGQIKRCKIHLHDGKEYIYALGQYSMAPRFALSIASKQKQPKRQEK